MPLDILEYPDGQCIASWIFQGIYRFSRKSEVPVWIFQIIHGFSRKSTDFLDHPWIFQNIHRFSRSSMDFLENPQRQCSCLWIFQNIQRGNALLLGFSRKSMGFLDNALMQFGYPSVPVWIFQNIHGFSRKSMDVLENLERSLDVPENPRRQCRALWIFQNISCGISSLFETFVRTGQRKCVSAIRWISQKPYPTLTIYK